ncbi:hypothetical protein [Picrophilus oshimae]|uniref:Uncharacterized protein n=1 Tax=Picrophilus torridus (strain ATCC 700027 / DSM 9790 / JCM 10055 / NBRC 100828 / KAW 2/3) TaxID=1122961 RepID=Q6KZU4_PICTO|nr:hypothetical protein [Picrophilus oshimae]AAT43758.1 hypothetical protein PTO1173 [Picrophilus oshimae DSM 9789]SMD31385.1 hypothetical protein SAMN02745355_1317 [Picrophilus oshimae DSM 9789]
MIISFVTFRDGKMIEPEPGMVMNMDDIKKALAYAFLYDYNVTVFSSSGNYSNVKILSIKVNEKGNLFFSGLVNSGSSKKRQNFSWREISSVVIEIEKAMGNVYF